MVAYKSLYIDALYKLFNNKKYKDIHKVLVIEPDSFPNCITNYPKTCDDDACYKSYFPGIQYALEKLSTLPNTYCYLDIAHESWLGWDISFNSGTPSAIANLFNGKNGSYQGQGAVIQAKGKNLSGSWDISSWPSMIYGFSSNVSNYLPLGKLCSFWNDLDTSGSQCDSIKYGKSVCEKCILLPNARNQSSGQAKVLIKIKYLTAMKK